MKEDSVSFSKVYEFSMNMYGGYRFVPRFWAQDKIRYLLDLIEVHGKTDELV
jgi:hypothetical protein